MRTSINTTSGLKRRVSATACSARDGETLEDVFLELTTVREEAVR